MEAQGSRTASAQARVTVGRLREKYGLLQWLFRWDGLHFYIPSTNWMRSGEACAAAPCNVYMFDIMRTQWDQ